MEKQIELYRSPDGKTELSVRFNIDTVWLSQKEMAELFERDSDTISLHLKNIYDDDELMESSTTEYFSVVQKEGKRNVNRKIKYYNLDAIISVGYRVNSKRGTESNCRNVEVLNCRVTIFYFPFSFFFSRVTIFYFPFSIFFHEHLVLCRGRHESRTCGKHTN
ncbi:MAG: virulence RhuM family protein [Sphingobacteriales bacterium]|nr:virulence RhuM family protein [Sphingobacteriales bacterium]